MRRSVQLTSKHVGAIFAGLAGIAFVLYFMFYIPIRPTLQAYALLPDTSLLQTIFFALSPDLYVSRYSIFDIILIFTVAGITGINFSLLTILFKQNFRRNRLMGTSLFGSFLGMLGIGCASCGSVLLATIFGVGTATKVLGFLPFGGVEFMLLGMFILLYSTYILFQKVFLRDICLIKR